jgi:hypothetical protein
MTSQSLVPERLLRRMVAEAAFDDAYAAVPDDRRAWLKTCIACLCSRYGESRTTFETHLLSHPSGFACRTGVSPLEWGVLFLGDGAVSAPSILAALLPLRLAGTREVVVVRVREKRDKNDIWPAPLLIGLELTGQEAVLDLTLKEARLLLDSLCKGEGRGTTLFLGSGKEVESLAGRCASIPRVFCWQGALPLEVGVWNAPCCFDLDVLAWAHPQARLRVWEEDSTDHREASQRFEAFLAQECELLCVPSDKIEAALGRAEVVIGPGGEGCWVWPDLSPDLFRSRRAAWLYEPGGE